MSSDCFFTAEFSIEPEIYSDQENLVAKIRDSLEIVRLLGGEVLSSGVYLGLPMSKCLDPEIVQQSIEAGYATVSISYVQDGVVI